MAPMATHSKRIHAQCLSLHQKANPIQWIPACAGKTEESPFMTTQLTAYGRLPRERGDPPEAYSRSMSFPASKSQSDSIDSRLRGKDGGISVHDDSIDGLWPSSPRTRGPTRSVFTLNVFPCIKKPIRFNGFPPAWERRRKIRQ